MFRSMKGRVAAGSSVLAVLAVLAVALGIGLAQPQDQASNQTRSEKVKVGTYEVERVFHGYHETQKFVEYVQGLEQEAQAAQEAQNFQRLMELQFDAQSRQERLMESFNAAIDRVVPDVAKERNLRLVALELIYFGESVEPEDITDVVITAINVDADEPTDPDSDP